MKIPTLGYDIPAAHVQQSEDDNYHLCETVMPTRNDSAGHDEFHMHWTCFFAPRRTSMLPAPPVE